MAQNPDSTEPSRPNGEAPAAYVTLILDETGSMQHCKGAAMAGVNEYLKTLRQMPTPVRFTLTLFNSGKLDVRHRHEPVTHIAELTEDTYRPEASTPLYDAIGHTLTAAGREAPPESRKLCVILTDGLENASREYTRDGIARLIKDHEAKGWTFVYLGADHDAWAAGGDLGIPGDNTVQFCKRDTGRTFGQLSEATSAYLSNQSGKPAQGFWKDAGAAPIRTTASGRKEGGRTMTPRPLILLMVLAGAGPAWADMGFDQRYERDYNIFNPVTQYQPDNPLNPANAYSPDNPFNPVNRYDPGNPANPVNKYSPNNPFNPVNRYHPENPLNPTNQYNPSVPFGPLDGGSGKVRR